MPDLVASDEASPAAPPPHASTASTAPPRRSTLVSTASPSASGELFDTKNFGVNHNILVSNIPMDSLCFGYFSAFLYRREAAARGSATCSGASCYQATFTIWGAICVVGTLLCIVLYVRSRSFSGRLLAQKLLGNKWTEIAKVVSDSLGKMSCKSTHLLLPANSQTSCFCSDRVYMGYYVS